MNKLFMIDGKPKHRINYKGNIIPLHYIKLWKTQYAYEMGVPEHYVKYVIENMGDDLPLWTPLN